MRNNNCELSLPVFSFGDSCWSPSLDIAHFINYDYYKSDRIFWVEELHHRILFIGTEVRLWMSWMEFLSNYEFMLFLNEIRTAQTINQNLKIQIPISYNLSNPKLPIYLKIKIENLIQACTGICLLNKICEPVLEAITTWSLSKSFEDEPKLKRIVSEVVRQKNIRYNSTRIYPRVKKLCENIQENLIDVIDYVFGPLTKTSRANFPPLLLSEANEDFNEICFQQIPRRFNQVLRNFANDSFSKQKFGKFIDDIYDESSNPNIVRDQLKVALSVLSDIIQINNPDLVQRSKMEVNNSIKAPDNTGVFDNHFSIVQSLITPVFVPVILWGEMEMKTYERSGIDPKIALGTPFLMVIEDLNTGVHEIKEFTSLPTREPFLSDSLRFTYSLTNSKYFLLSGKWSNLLSETNDDKKTVEAILQEINFSVVTN